MGNVCTIMRHNHTVPLDHHMYAELGFGDKYIGSFSASVPAMADTGCQSCLVGLKVIHRLGLRESDLIP